MKDTCGNCKWWRQVDGTDEGDCHANPPTLNVEIARLWFSETWRDSPDKGQFEFESTDALRGLWPSTRDDDFCGKFEQLSE